MEPRLKRIVAHAFGRRSKKTFRNLLKLLVGFNVAFWCTDNFSTYDMLPNEKHIIGKLYTQRIERENLNFRNRLKRLNRKTLGYSKSVEMHDKIIGTFIEREYYLQRPNLHIEYATELWTGSAKEFREEILAFFRERLPALAGALSRRINDNFQALEKASSS